MKLILDILRGMVIGLANVIPGVSGGTMMVSMGIYDKLIWSINHLFKKFTECVKILWPYALGMVIAILLGAKVLDKAFESFPLPTNTLFIGLILGSLPFILKEIRGEKIGWQGILVFVLFFAVVVVLKAVEKDNRGLTVELSVFEIIKLFLMGAVASATMVVPGVSGSMILKTLGYYEVIVTKGITGLMSALSSGDWAAFGHYAGILVPFGLGIVFGIFAIAKLIAFLMKKWKGRTYCAILGMVAASPVVILMDTGIYEGFNVWIGVAAAAALALGVFVSMKLGGEPETLNEAPSAD